MHKEEIVRLISSTAFIIYIFEKNASKALNLLKRQELNHIIFCVIGFKIVNNVYIYYGTTISSLINYYKLFK